MREEIKQAVDVAQRAQRNYDLSKSIPKEDLEQEGYGEYLKYFL
jgi:hypothetical protein